MHVGRCERSSETAHVLMKENKSNNPKTEDVMLIRAFKIDDIDLEPTEDEIDYFLTHDYTVAMEGALSPALRSRWVFWDTWPFRSRMPTSWR